jgi:hypothetical protein
MPKHSHKRHRRHKRRTRSHGGSFSMGPSFIQPGQLVVGRNLIGPDCLAAQRPGTLSYVSREGLPGMSGGASLCAPGAAALPLRQTQSGGRYQVDLEGMPLKGLGGVVSIPCESARSNSLNLRGGGPQGAPDIALETPTASYQNTVIQANGRPLMIQTPQAVTRSCLTVGGRRRGKRRGLKKHTRKHKSKRHH